MAEAQAPIFPQLVGILNVTPDSFSDGGKYFTAEDAIRQAFTLREEGADIIDVGGESSGPNSKPISVDEEWSRIEPVLKVVGREMTISIDTYKSEIARRALDYGAIYINDISALRADPEMSQVAASAGCKIILMHSKEEDSAPHVSDSVGTYQNVVFDVSAFLQSRIKFAVDKGIKAENIILDPGLGLFISKNAEYSWELMRRIEELLTLGPPLFVGVSRKGFLKTAEETSPSDRDPVSALLAVHLAKSGVSYIRTHNVKMTRTFLKTWHNVN